MKILLWEDREADRFRESTSKIENIVDRLPDIGEIMEKVRARGDAGLVELTQQYDNACIHDFRVREDEIKQAAERLPTALVTHILRASANVHGFSEKQFLGCAPFRAEIQGGVTAGQEVIPIDRIGIYVPGGRYPLVSSLLMAAVPAQVAGVKEIAVCTPPARDGCVSPLLLGAAHMLGLNEIYRVGGAQAVAALAFGTESIPKVDKIVGPGNSYVNAAKRWVYGAVGIDFIAGPSEVLIFADGGADPVFLASDLIAQAEHDPQAEAILLTNSPQVALCVQREIELQLKKLKTAVLVEQALEENGAILVVRSWDEAVEYTNRKAPEHLILNVQDPDSLASRLKHYGSLFIGALATVVLGDYSAGINHILPTSGAARYTGGLSVRDFLKFQTSLQIEPEGFSKIGPTAVALSKAEGLDGHMQACRRRYHSTNKDEL